MPQLNINVTPDFQRNLARFMRLRRIKTKSEAIRAAIEECLHKSLPPTHVADFHSWLGLGRKAPENARPKFPFDASLWKEPR